MRRLHYDINSMVAFEEVMGDSLVSLIQDKDRMSSFKTLRALYWAGTDTKASLEEAGKKMMDDIANGQTFMDISEAIGNALQESGILGDRTENPPKKPKKAETK